MLQSSGILRTWYTTATPPDVPSGNVGESATFPERIGLSGCLGRGIVREGDICELCELDPGHPGFSALQGHSITSPPESDIVSNVANVPLRLGPLHELDVRCPGAVGSLVRSRIFTIVMDEWECTLAVVLHAYHPSHLRASHRFRGSIFLILGDISVSSYPLWFHTIKPYTSYSSTSTEL